MLEYEAENEVVRGGIDLAKEDSEMGATPQGNSSFAGIDPLRWSTVLHQPRGGGRPDLRCGRGGNDHHHG